MKSAKISHLNLGHLIIPFLVFFILLVSPAAQAQDSDNLQPAERYNQEELAQMLAPIALYPDALLSQILMASTYPIEVIEADRWVKKNPDLKSNSLDDALINMEWDPSVKALCHFPSTLALMSERIAETTSLGNAFLAQESEVLDMIQTLREEAYTQGNLKTTAEQKVIVKKEKIIIEPADPRIIYVPYYDPYFVYGSWWWTPAYAPYYWGPVGVSLGARISFWPGVYFGVSFFNWSYFDWPRHYIYIDIHKRPRYVSRDRWIVSSVRWSHVPSHRHGVAYRDKSTARKYRQAPPRPATFRWDIRGYPERNKIEQVHPREPQTKTNRYRPEQKQPRLVPERQRQPQVEQKKQNQNQVLINKQKRVERKNQLRPDDIFYRVDDGKRERQSSERGRHSRKVLKTGVNNNNDWDLDYRKSR